MRSSEGKFIAKGDEIRQVRAIRLSDSTWEAFGQIADDCNCSKADFLEEVISEENKGDLIALYEGKPRNTPSEIEDKPSNTRNVAEVIELLESLKDTRRYPGNKGGSIRAVALNALEKLL